MDSSAPRARILVVAPNADLMHSLAFMLKAEGFDVDTRSHWQLGDDIGSSQVMIIDHGSFPRGFRDNGVLERLGAKLVVLASRPTVPPGLERAILVRKPLLNHDLANALHAALATPTT